MALMRDMSRAQMAFQVSSRPLDEFQVIRFKGTEGISQLYRFDIDMASSAGLIEFGDIVGQAAALSVFTRDGERWFHGIVSRFEMVGETHERTQYRAELVPTMWLLTHRYCSRIFQNKSVKDIITDVVTEAGIASDRIDLSRLTRNYTVREYCVQYRETDFNFISRLMEYEGILYWFEQAQDKHVMILAEKAGDHPSIEGDETLPYHPPTGLNVETDHVYRFRVSQAVRPGAVVLNDFNFENPPLNLEAQADGGRDPGLEFADFPGEYRAQSEGVDLATLRVEEFGARRTLGQGQSNCRRLSPGHKFTLSEHPGGFDGQYLITRVTHQGKESVSRTTGGCSMVASTNRSWPPPGIRRILRSRSSPRLCSRSPPAWGRAIRPPTGP